MQEYTCLLHGTIEPQQTPKFLHTPPYGGFRQKSKNQWVAQIGHPTMIYFRYKCGPKRGKGAIGLWGGFLEEVFHPQAS